MLQISQTEKPIFSATIDQIRLRRATNLPVDSQNALSSGLQSEIQLGCCALIGFSLSDLDTGDGMDPRSRDLPGRRVTIRMSDVSSDGVGGVGFSYSRSMPSHSRTKPKAIERVKG